MKILHTSDLHIGKKLEGRERLAEQREVLEEIYRIIIQTGTELIICAGDIFDTFIPSAEAERLFFEYAVKFAGNGRAFVVISGNHDDGKRLSASVPLSQQLNIFIADNQNLSFNKTAGENVVLKDSGEGYLIFENNKKERVFINVLPYPSEYRFREESSDEDFITRMQRWLNKGHEQNKDNIFEILAAHIFTAGGFKTEGEREIELGGARAYPPELLPDCDYIALGHLHRFQKAGKKNAYYSGSVMQYAFDEAGTEKCVITFDSAAPRTDGEVRIQKHNLQCGKRLARLSCQSMDDAEKLLEKHKDCYIELTLYLDRPLGGAEIKNLTARYPDILSIIPVIETGITAKQTRKNLNKREMFIAYHKHLYNAEPDTDLLALYLELMEGE